MTKLFQPRRCGLSAQLAAFLSAFILLGPSGCSSDGSESQQGPSISPQLDTARQAIATIGAAGGSLTAIGSDGTEYTLTIPADALLEDTPITLIPIIDIPDLPMSGGFLGGAQFEPSGLELFRTATLRVTLPSAPDLDSDALLAGFVYDEDGKNLALTIAEADGESFSLPVLHFSGGGAGSATSSDLKETFVAGTADAFATEILEALNDSDAQTMESSIRRWYEEKIKPALQAAAASDQALERALPEYQRWLNAEGLVFVSGLVDRSALLSDSRTLAAAALRDAIARANDLCERQKSFIEAEKALIWQRRAESVQLPEDLLLANGLDWTSVERDLCVQVLFESTSFPQAPAVGEPALLQVVVGFAFGEEPIEFSSGMVVNMLATGANPAGATEFTDDSGRVELTLTPDGATVEIEVCACIGGAVGAGTVTGGFICQEAFIVRGLVVSPATVTLAPGAGQQFTAELLGVDEDVTWSATGGTIDQSGRFVAGSTSGTFTVTAISLTDPSLVATARVTIEGNPVEPVTILFLGDFEAIEFGRLEASGPAGIKVVQAGSLLEIFFPTVIPDSVERPFRTPVEPEWVHRATLSGSSFSGSRDGCSKDCEITGTLDGDQIVGRVGMGPCTNRDGPGDCYVAFDATMTDKCVDLSTDLKEQIGCQP